MISTHLILDQEEKSLCDRNCGFLETSDVFRKFNVTNTCSFVFRIFLKFSISFVFSNFLKAVFTGAMLVRNIGHSLTLESKVLSSPILKTLKHSFKQKR